jgi:hypothetical protein
MIIAALSLATGCIKVSHLGDRTAKSYDSVFALQKGQIGALQQPKAMEAELGAEATRNLVASGKKSCKTSIGVAGGLGK